MHRNRMRFHLEVTRDLTTNSDLMTIYIWMAMTSSQILEYASATPPPLQNGQKQTFHC